MNIDLNARSQQLMKSLVERYIEDGQPVGSKTLSEDKALAVSSATIRNVMKQLEDHGLIRSPHTSAGRIPTEAGYRFYVDTMLSTQPVQKPMAQEIQEELSGQGGAQQVVQKASSLLSNMTQMAGVVMVPKQESASLRQIEFLPLDGNQILAILVVNNQEVQNRIITTERRYERRELEQAANYLNSNYSGKHVKDMCRGIHQELLNTQSEVKQLMELVVKVTGQIEEVDTSSEDLFVQGQSNLIGGAGMSDMGQLKRLFDAFSEKRDIAHLLDSCTKGDGVQIYIGHESGYEPLGDCSVVTAPYAVEGEAMGVLGVIGPTRMNYERVVPVVDMTAKLVSSALSHES